MGTPNYQFSSYPFRPVLIDAQGGTVVFDGVYHVRSMVELVNGTFEVRPGTTFYTEGGPRNLYSGLYSGCYLNGVLDGFLQL